MVYTQDLKSCAFGIEGSSPSTRTKCTFRLVAKDAEFFRLGNRGSNPLRCAKNFCPGDGIGIRVGLRSQILRVRVSPGAPIKLVPPLLLFPSLGVSRANRRGGCKTHQPQTA
jgi:hypothetical protein